MAGDAEFNYLFWRAGYPYQLNLYMDLVPKPRCLLQMLYLGDDDEVHVLGSNGQSYSIFGGVIPQVSVWQ